MITFLRITIFKKNTKGTEKVKIREMISSVPEFLAKCKSQRELGQKTKPYYNYGKLQTARIRRQYSFSRLDV